MSKPPTDSVNVNALLVVVGALLASCERTHPAGALSSSATSPETHWEIAASLTDFIDSIRNDVLDGEDDEATCALDDPRSGADWEALARRLSFELPASLRTWWEYCDGGDYFGSMMMSMREVPAQYIDGMDTVAFHSWGNGDFDHVVAKGNDRYPEGAVIFYCHENGRHALVTRTLEEWFRAVHAEVETEGGVYHPFDYLHPSRADKQGMYRRVFEEIRE